MAKMTSAERNALPDSEFAEPGARKYPINDAAHQKNAKARASQQEKKGNLSPGAKAKIDKKADKLLGAKEDMKKEMRSRPFMQ